MTPRPSTAESEALAALPRLPRDEGGPVFVEPWQAQAFALAGKLSEQGHFTWKESAGCPRVRRIPMENLERAHSFAWTDGPSHDPFWWAQCMVWRAAVR
jgi:hypothetical protein